MQILKILIIISLLIFPLGELLRIDLPNNITIKPLDILAGTITLYWLILFTSKRIKKIQIHWFYFIFPIVCLISLLVNAYWLQLNQLLASSLYLIRWVSYLGVLFAILQTDNAFKKTITTLLLIDGIIIVLLGIIQYFFFSNLKPLYYLGWDDHLYRLFSVFLDPNFTGAVLVIFVIFIGSQLSQILINTGSRSVTLTYIKNISISRKKYIDLLCLTLLLTLFALFVTFSRSSLIMLMVSATCYLILIGRKKLILWFFGALAAGIVIISPYFYVENINLFRLASTNARLENLEAALSISKQNPLLGVGFNTYRYAKDRYHIESGWTKTPSHADAGVDNSFIFILVTTGIIGLIAYLILWFHLFKTAIVTYRKGNTIYAAVFIASAMGIFVHAMFINSLFYPAIMYLLWILYGLMERK